MYSKRYDVIKVYVVVGVGGVQKPTGPQSRFVEGLLGGGVQQPTGPQSRFVEGLLGGGVEQPTGPQCRFLQ